MAGPSIGRPERWCIATGAALLLALAGACGSGPVTQSSPLPFVLPSATPTPPPRVAIISIDGLRPDALSTTSSPSILALLQRGSYTFTAQTTFPSTTLPGHTSMLTGVEPATHGITFDEYRESFQLQAPTALSLVHAAGKRAVMVVGKSKFRQLAAAGSVDAYVEATRGDTDVVNEAVVLLPLGFDLLFVHLPQVDQTGHASGWMSDAYMAQLQETDAAVGRLVALLPAGTTVILTADHGGQMKNHGTREACDMTIPWIIVGPRVLHHGLLTRPVRTVDTAIMALSLLGVTAPPNASGKPVSEALEVQ